MNISIGKTEEAEDIQIRHKTLLRHMVCLGASGSGKTVLCKVICEEFIRNQIPVIAIDPQGDIASLLHTSLYEDVADKGISQDMIDEYKKNAEVVIWTPASSIGVPLSLNPIGLIQDIVAQDKNYEECLRSISLSADSIISLVGEEVDSDTGRLLSAILNISLTYIVENRLEIEGFASLADLLNDCPEDLSSKIAPIASLKEVTRLSKKLRLLTVGAKKLLFDLAKPLNVEELLGLSAKGKRKKTRLSVIYLNTLSSQEEKEFFVARITSALYDWMLANPSNELQALFYIDEVAPFIPPVRKPVCKDILKILLKQARKYGVGCLIASQNPGDIDYKAISQCSTWNLGRLISRQDIKKVEKILRSISPGESENIVAELPTLSAGQFLLFAPDEYESMKKFQVRWLITQHKTLDEEQVKNAVDDKMRKKYLNKAEKKLSTTVAVSESEVEEEEEDGTTTAEENIQISERILLLLAKEVSCLTCAEIADRLELNVATIRKYLNKLNHKVARTRYGRSFIYWLPQYNFLPQYDLIQRIEVSKLQILEQQAIALAQKRLKKQLIFFETEKVTHSDLQYIPLWQVHFTEEIESSFLIFSKTSSKDENIYFHAFSGKIAVYNRNRGFSFVDTPRESPSVLCDLDDVCTFQTVFPGEIDFEWSQWKNILSRNDIQKRIARKFHINVHQIAITFLPVWRFEISTKNARKKRLLVLDGVTGMPVEEIV
ncbi:helicase HerA-like domain-containing protein [Candidatus Uabimicrobium amorphum]|uniref:ATP-binding protein n=1 Tax=Uabimicrobium amorphum TaxID=2596890 RepID=A0A5S9F2T7_UABAM|nr:helicase HerA-like domain-containing protein [Candidatus Uabimicrobium amorphum]BBM83798.1 ATP-binding protein [Candidatus Uabimicrobium amorphum]